jgi:hypothetical protein
MIDTKTCRWCSKELPLDAYEPRARDSASAVCRACLRETKSASAHRKKTERLDREQALRDEIWAAMWRGRSQRALSAVQPRRSGRHHMKLRAERGFISVAELACRCIERDAAHRAANECKTAEAVADAVRILEKPTPTVERSYEVSRLWRPDTIPINTDGLKLHANEVDEDKRDPFADAYGDWTPLWMRAAAA